MNILVIGKGQLGQCIQDEIEMYSFKNKNDRYFFYGHDKLDITNEKSINVAFSDVKPKVVINCAAYTDVNKAETEVKKAYEVNSTGVYNLKKACKKAGAYLIHISTDYVFDGEKGTPYTEEDGVTPLNNYGITKLSGEIMLYEDRDAMIIRTSWLYSQYGKNFFKTILGKILAGEDLKVVYDQIGTPTYADGLAYELVRIVDERLYKSHSGVYHFSDEGCCSWYDFAELIRLFAIEYLSDKITGTTNITPVLTENKKGMPKRPVYSVLDKTRFYNDFYEGKRPGGRHWADGVLCAIFDYMKPQ